MTLIMTAMERDLILLSTQDTTRASTQLLLGLVLQLNSIACSQVSWAEILIQDFRVNLNLGLGWGCQGRLASVCGTQGCLDRQMDGCANALFVFIPSHLSLA